MAGYSAAGGRGTRRRSESVNPGLAEDDAGGWEDEYEDGDGDAAMDGTGGSAGGVGQGTTQQAVLDKLMRE